MVVAALAIAAYIAPPAAAASQRLPKPPASGRGHGHLASSLAQIAAARRDKGIAEASIAAADLGLRSRGSRAGGEPSVTTVLETDGSDAVVSGARAAGAEITARYGSLVEADVPLDRLEAVAAVSGVRLARAPFAPREDIVSEGVSQIGAMDWQNAGMGGAGASVAIVDLGFDGYTAALGGELPPTVDTSCTANASNLGGTPHGTNVAELVHDVAPAASLFLVKITDEVSLGLAVDCLIARRVNVVNHSVSWSYSGPGDGTGLVDGIVSKATANGIVWVNSAGNTRRSHWSGSWIDTNNDGWLDISPNGSLQGFVAGSRGTVEASLRWDDPWGAACDDYDLVLFDAALNILATAQDVQSCASNPLEDLEYTQLVPGSAYYIGVGRFGGTRANNLDLLLLEGYPISISVPQGSITTPADNATDGMIAVGAVDWSTTAQETFSAEGPTKTQRIKPDLAGPDRVSIPGGTFAGTSAASPHVAGAAALVKAAHPEYAPAAVRAELFANARDLGAPGADNQYGAGEVHLAAIGGNYHALAPARVLDTRSGSGLPHAGEHLGPAGTVTFQVTGAGNVPSDRVLSVVLNVTAVGPTAASYLTVYPAGVGRPWASNLNVVAGQSAVPNLVNVPVGAAGQVTIYNNNGTVDVVADVEGYVTRDQTGTTGLFQPLAPSRVLDTRTGSGQPHAGERLSAGATVDFQVAGLGGVPVSGASAVVLNVTAVAPTERSYLTAYSSGAQRPLASNLNFGPERYAVPNRVIVPVGQNGRVTIYNDQGQVDVVADVAGWFTDSLRNPPGSAVFSGLAPARIADTRPGSGQPYAASTLHPGATIDVRVASAGGVPAIAAPSTPKAAVLNVTIVGGTASSYLTVYPANVSRPLASDLNWQAGDVRPNLVIVKLSSDGYVRIYNNAGDVDVVVDVVGWYW